MPITQLKTATLGTTGLEITRVGFGAWAIGGGGWEAGWGRRTMTSRSPRLSAEDVEQIEKGER